jgi:hypothetical protein
MIVTENSLQYKLQLSLITTSLGERFIFITDPSKCILQFIRRYIYVEENVILSGL